MAVRVEVRVKSNLRKIGPGAVRRIDLALEKAARDIEALGKAVVPVDTGALKNSIQARKTDKELEREVAAGQHYAGFVEFGTTRMPARPFLTPAFERVRPTLVRAIERAIAEEARRQGV